MTENKHWFEVWFDSPYYSLLYQHRDKDEAKLFIDHIFQKLNVKTSAKILDMPCGEGRHSIYLNSKGFDVTGIDLSERSIEVAKPHENSGLHFFIADMRSFDLGQKFDVIMNLFTSFGYFQKVEDNELALDRIYNHLKDEGVFILDFFNSNKVVRDLVVYDSKEIEGVEFKIEKEIDEGKVIKTIHVKDQENEHRFQEKVQLFSQQELKELLKKHQFQVIDTYGDHELNDFDEQLSDRLIIFATKIKGSWK